MTHRARARERDQRRFPGARLPFSRHVSCSVRSSAGSRLIESPLSVMLPSADYCDVIYVASCVALSAVLVAALLHTFQLMCNSISCSSGGGIGKSSPCDRQMSPVRNRIAAMTSLFRNFASAVCNVETGDGESEKRRITGKAMRSRDGCVE